MPRDSLKRLPFDYYGRYRLAAEVAEAVTRPGAWVLDVGGAAGALSAFLDDRDVVSCDLQRSDDPRVAATTLVLGDARRLPFPDGSFDLVVSLDTLEHVVPADRPLLLREALRVARHWLLLACPCATDGVADADNALLAYLRQRFGEDFATVGVLTEHLVLGHPDAAEVAAHLEAAGARVARFPSGLLDRWLPMMLLFHELLALGRDDPVERVQAWYNERHWRDDLRAPSYRQAFLAGLDGDAPGSSAPEDVVAGILPAGEGPTDDVVGFEALRRVLDDSLLEATRALDTRVRALEGELAEVHRELGESTRRAARAEEQVQQLGSFRDRVLAHPAVRARSLLRRRDRRPSPPR